MDTAAYLRKHGWRGDGHSLDTSGRGIRKPLLVSKKVDVLGLGINKHLAVSDQWWMRAFDQGLKDFGTGKTSALRNAQKFGVKYSGLYGRFVRGEGIPATLEENKKAAAKSTGKRKRDTLEVQDNLREGRKSRTKSKRSRLDSDRDRKRAISRQTKAFIQEAERRCLIPAAPKEKSSPLDVDVVAVYGAPAISLIFDKAGLSSPPSSRRHDSVDPADKANRARLKRRVKRAAKEYLAENFAYAGNNPGEGI